MSECSDIYPHPCVTNDSFRAYAKIVGTTDSEHLAALLFTIISELSAQSGGPGGTAAWSASHPIIRIVQAFETLLTTILNLQRDLITKCKASGVSNAAPPTSSLNLCVTDGEQLVALRFHSHPVQQPPSLYWTNEAGVVLNRKFEGSPSSSFTTAANTNANAAVDATTKRLAANSRVDHTSASVGEVSYGTSGRAAEDHGPHLIVASEPTTEQQEDAAKWHVVPKNSYVLFGRETEEKVQIQRVELDWEKELGWAT
jgi:glutamine amidotransferase